MPTFEADSRSPTPIYAQLDRSIRAAIATGALGAGVQLPTVRQLAVELSINANTVARVYAELERDDVLETRRGVGSFVAATASQARPPTRRPAASRAMKWSESWSDASSAGAQVERTVFRLR